SQGQASESIYISWNIKDGYYMYLDSIKLKELMLLNNISNQNLIKTGQNLVLNSKKDVYFIGDDNFIAITKYNISHFYAMAVYYLSKELKI
ncbi:lytic murein transglycosylase, partial [Gammaproteobacteria bacterium]|nr:lytic murein transglycosylase [Gammaproteobacteria bacterium]